MRSFPEPIISPAWSSGKKPVCKTRLQSLNAISDKVHHQTQTGLCSWARPHLVPVAMPQCILKYHKMWNDRRFHFIIWYMSSYRAVVAGNKQGCCMTHSKALRKALRLYARITKCHCQGVHTPQVSHKWLSLNIKISKVFCQPPPDSAPLLTNDCVHLENVDPSAGITPHIDTDTITPPVSVRLFQKQTSGLPPEGIRLSLYMFAHDPAIYPFSSIHGPIQGHCVPFPLITGWGPGSVSLSADQETDTPMSNLESPVTLTHTCFLDSRRKLVYQDRTHRKASVLIPGPSAATCLHFHMYFLFLWDQNRCEVIWEQKAISAFWTQCLPVST